MTHEDLAALARHLASPDDPGVHRGHGPFIADWPLEERRQKVLLPILTRAMQRRHMSVDPEAVLQAAKRELPKFRLLRRA